MKNLLIISILVLMGGCTTRKAELNKERSKTFESNVSERLSPGAQIAYFPPVFNYPLPTPNKPTTNGQRQRQVKRDTLIKGNDGSEMWVFFNPDGSYKGSICNCPPINEKTASERSEERQLKHKLTQREFDVKIAKEVRYTVWGLGLIFALAWVVRGAINK